MFLEKAFLYDNPNLTGGVELFNLTLIKEMTDLGYPLLIPANPGWSHVINNSIAKSSVEILESSSRLDKITGGLLTAWKLRKKHFPLLLIGNTGNRLIPIIWALKKINLADHYLAILHREPRQRFVNALKGLPIDVLTVNDKIASHFDRRIFPNVKIHYGIMRHEQFHPGKPITEGTKQQVDFCVLGHLDRKWKGSDTAVAAFRELPNEIRTKCRLHLIGFVEPPAFPEQNIITYKWKSPGEIADLLRQMDVMIVPSRDENVMRETFSQSAVQGMLSGLPLIVSDLPVLTEKINNGGGLVFHDNNELTHAMSKLAINPNMRSVLGEQGRQTALDRYVWSTQVFIDKFVAPYF